MSVQTSENNEDMAQLYARDIFRHHFTRQDVQTPLSLAYTIDYVKWTLIESSESHKYYRFVISYCCDHIHVYYSPSKGLIELDGSAAGAMHRILACMTKMGARASQRRALAQQSRFLNPKCHNLCFNRQTRISLYKQEAAASLRKRGRRHLHPFRLLHVAETLALVTLRQQWLKARSKRTKKSQTNRSMQ